MRHERWRDNWRVVSPIGAIRVAIPRDARAREELALRLLALEPGTAVVISATALRARSRCDAFARRAGLQARREYLAFPSAETPAYLVEDAPATVRYFLASVLVVPTRGALALPMELGLRLLRTIRPWRLLRPLTPGYLVVAIRT